MKSQNSSLQLGAQEGDEYSGSLCLDFGFKTVDVMAAAELLDDAELMYTQDRTSLKDYDFCAIVYEHLRDSIRTWKARTLDKSNKSMTMPGCIIIIMGFIVDNLKLTEIVDKKCPGINQYTMETLMCVIGNAKCHHGMISFDNFKLKALEEICYVESSRFYIQSPVDSQVSAVVTSRVPPETQMSMLLHQAHGLLSAVQPVAQSIGIDLEAVNECIDGLSAMQPLDLEKIGVAQSGAVNRGLARSDAGASCSISEDVEDAEAAKS